MKTASIKIMNWLIPLLGISLICFCWNFDWFSQFTKMVDREEFEKFLNRQITAFFSDKNSTGHDVVKSDMPEMAALQDYLVTVDPELKRVPKERLKGAYLKTRELEKELSFKSCSQLQWQGTVANIGGRVRAIMWDPNDPLNRKVWAGGVTGGLWYREDITSENDHWIPVDDFWPDLAISCMAYDPNDPQTFYVGTGEAQTALIIYRESSGIGFGIMRSTDAGQTWEVMPGTEDFEYVTDIVVRNENGISVIYAGVVSGVYKGVQHLSQPSDGLFRKVVGSGTWEQVLPDISGLDVPYSPSDIELGADGRMFVGTMPNVEGEGGATILFSDNALPESWSVNEEYKIQIENTPGFDLPGRVILAAAPSDANRVYALVAQGYFYGLPGYECHIISRSDDKGVNWQIVSVPPPGSNGNWAFIAWHALTAAVDPNNADRVYIGALDLWRSDNAGLNWSKKSSWTSVGNTNYIHADHHRILFREGLSDKFIVASDGGIFYTFNASLNFPTFQEKSEGFNILQMYKCALHPDAGAVFYLAGMQDNGTIYCDGNPITNDNRITGGDGGACFIDKNEPDVFITSYQNNRFFLFGNYQLQNNAIQWQSGNFISSVDYDYNLNTIYANAVTTINTLADSILRITGVPYGPVEGEFLFMGTGSTVPYTTVKYSEYSTVESATLYLGTQSGRMFRVADANTQPVVNEIGSAAFPQAAISCIALGGSEDTILVTFSNYGVSSVWQSYDGAINWDEKEGNLPDMPVRWALYHPHNARAAMLATEIGVWTSNNLHSDDVTWQPDNSGLANVRVDMLQLRGNDNTVLAGTHGRGFYTTTFQYNPATSVKEISADDLYIYPNPASEVLYLNCYENFNGKKEIEIYHNNGSLVKKISVRFENQKSSINISDLTTGTYYVKILNGNKPVVNTLIKL
jgi:hypothetical protein